MVVVSHLFLFLWKSFRGRFDSCESNLPLFGTIYFPIAPIVVEGAFLCYYQSIEFLCGYGGKVPKELVEFLEFVGANVEESEKDYGNSLIRQIQRTIRGIKTDRETGEILEELRKKSKKLIILIF